MGHFLNWAIYDFFPGKTIQLSLFQKSNKKGIFDLIRKAYELIEQH